MATSNPNRTSLAERVAAEKNQAAAAKQLKMRVASAWTLAKTLVPSAPAGEQLKVAKNLLLNSTTALKAMLRQAAVNAHFTRVAEEFKNVHKVDLNDLLEDPSVLSKAESAVLSEIKGEAKNAGKVADDRKENGEQPETYDEGKRKEPADMDASKAADRPKVDQELKEASAKKKACGEGCKGCDSCKKEDKKEAASKKAEDEAAAPAAEAPAENPVEETADAETEAADENAAEGDAEAESGDEAAADETEGEVFDEEKVTLQDAIEDVKADVEVLTEAIETEIGDADEINLAELGFEEGAEGEGDDMIPPADDMFADATDVAEVPAEGDGEELNIDQIFSDENMADKAAALSNEDDGDSVMDITSFFGPSDPADLEVALDQEESLMSPADLFKLDGADDDPMARLFATASKQASSEEGIVKPGELDSFFETDLSGDDRDADSDHDGDIFADVLESLKAPESGQHRDKQDSTNELKPAPAGKEAGKKKAGKFPRLASHFDPMKEASKLAGSDLAGLLMGNDSDFM